MCHKLSRLGKEFLCPAISASLYHHKEWYNHEKLYLFFRTELIDIWPFFRCIWFSSSLFILVTCFNWEMSSLFLFLYDAHVFLKICQQISITIYIGLFKYSVPMNWIMLQILDMLPKAMYRVSTYEETKAPEHSKGDSHGSFRFFAVLK